MARSMLRCLGLLPHVLLVLVGEVHASPAGAEQEQAESEGVVRGFEGSLAVMPPVEPDLGELRIRPAQAEVRLERAGLRQAPCGAVHFFVTARAILWSGLDEAGEPLSYRRNCDAEPAQWAMIDEPIYARATLSYEGQIIERLTVALPGNSATEIAFAPIEAGYELPPGDYELDLFLYPSRQQRSVLQKLWVEEFEERPCGTVRIGSRLHPRRLPPIRERATLSVARSESGGYMVVPQGAITARRQALFALGTLEDIYWMIHLIDRRGPDLRLHERHRLARLTQLARRIEALRPRQAALRTELAELDRQQEHLQERLAAYLDAKRDKARTFVLDVWKQWQELYWKTNLCRPRFHLKDGARGPHPQEPHKLIDYSIAELREIFGIGNGRYLDAPPDAVRDPREPEQDPVRGAWHDDKVPEGQEQTPRAQWLAWLEEQWEPRLATLRARYEQLFATSHAQRGAEEEARPYRVPLWAETADQFAEALQRLEELGRASANRLARSHDPSHTVDYPYSDRRGRPRPAPMRAVLYDRHLVHKLSQAVDRFAVAPLQAWQESQRDPEQASGERRRREMREPRLPNRFYRRPADGRVITEEAYEELAPEEQREFEPWCPVEGSLEPKRKGRPGKARPEPPCQGRSHDVAPKSAEGVCANDGLGREARGNRRLANEPPCCRVDVRKRVAS